MIDRKLIAEIMPISKLQISEFNVRKEHDNTDKVNELAKSIQEQGILQPLLVRPENGKYGIIIGSRRYSAAKKINLKNIPVTIKELGDTESLVVSVTENIQRNDLEPRETTRALSLLNETMTQEKIATKIGKDHSYVSNMVTVCELLTKLEKSGTEVKTYPKENEKKQKKAIPLYHAVFVAQAFNKPNQELKAVLEKEPDKDVEVAKAVTNISQELLPKVLKEFKKHPDDNIDEIVRQGEMGLLDDKDRGHALDYLGGRGDEDIDISHYEFQINYHAGHLCEYLTKIHHLPEATDDIEVDFVRKSRDFRKTLISELSPTSRAGIHSRLNYLNALIEETLEEIEKVQKKE